MAGSLKHLLEEVDERRIPMKNRISTTNQQTYETISLPSYHNGWYTHVPSLSSGINQNSIHYNQSTEHGILSYNIQNPRMNYHTLPQSHSIHRNTITTHYSTSIAYQEYTNGYNQYQVETVPMHMPYFTRQRQNMLNHGLNSDYQSFSGTQSFLHEQRPIGNRDVLSEDTSVAFKHKKSSNPSTLPVPTQWDMSITVPDKLTKPGVGSSTETQGVQIGKRSHSKRSTSTSKNANPSTPNNTISKHTQSRTQLKVRSSPRIALKNEVGLGRGHRARKATTVFSPRIHDPKPLVNRNTRPNRVRKPDSDNPLVNQIVRSIRNKLGNMRVHLAFIDAYELEGWRQTSSEKIKPTAELHAVRKKSIHAKRSIIRELNEYDGKFASDVPLPKDVSELRDDEILCSKCRKTETTETNDIVLCDSESCHRAYHQECLEPVLHTLPAEEEEWYCPRCEGIFKSLTLINAAFGATWETISELFPELSTEENSVELDDEEEDDEDFQDGGSNGDDSKGESDEEGTQDVSDDEVEYHKKTANVMNTTRRSMRSQRGVDDDLDNATDGGSDGNPEDLIVHGKRRRTIVDYRKLDGELFPQGGADEEDDNEYVPPAIDEDVNGKAVSIPNGKRRRESNKVEDAHDEYCEAELSD